VSIENAYVPAKNFNLLLTWIYRYVFVSVRLILKTNHTSVFTGFSYETFGDPSLALHVLGAPACVSGTNHTVLVPSAATRYILNGYIAYLVPGTSTGTCTGTVVPSTRMTLVRSVFRRPMPSKCHVCPYIRFWLPLRLIEVDFNLRTVPTRYSTFRPLPVPGTLTLVGQRPPLGLSDRRLLLCDPETTVQYSTVASLLSQFPFSTSNTSPLHSPFIS
jgi:hypothetical protein